MKDRSVFRETYHNYLDRLRGLDPAGLATPLGVEMVDGVAVIPLLGESFRVSGDGIADAAGKRPTLDVCVILANYLLRCPAESPAADDWATYYGLKDAGPLAVYFKQDVERAIASAFAGRIDALQAAGRAIDGRPAETDVACDLALSFSALPKVPLMLLFNDRDEEFSATVTVLFEQRAEAYLDPECLAMLGRHLFARLTA
ncbi:MAG: DUF3786 domain-containing protein [Thermodesulfobacteriota bacterium]|nr:DUF3786 domain-containing protein [Thermodesulfobacteriota bacterium]